MEFRIVVRRFIDALGVPVGEVAFLGPRTFFIAADSREQEVDCFITDNLFEGFRLERSRYFENRRIFIVHSGIQSSRISHGEITGTDSEFLDNVFLVGIKLREFKGRIDVNDPQPIQVDVLPEQVQQDNAVLAVGAEDGRALRLGKSRFNDSVCFSIQSVMVCYFVGLIQKSFLKRFSSRKSPAQFSLMLAMSASVKSPRVSSCLPSILKLHGSTFMTVLI